MDKNKIISNFSSFVQSFGLDNQMIAQKMQHSMNVANYSLDIANFLLLDESLKTCAFLVGLLHEFGSFKSITDNTPELRNKLTMQYLFKENQIENHTQNKTQIRLIKKVLQEFFKRPQPEEETNNNPQTEMLAQNTYQSKVLTLLSILKDADTLELFGMFKRKTIAPLINSNFTKKSFSKPVLDLFRAEKRVSIDDVSSNLDKVLLFMSLFFDLNHLISKNIALKIEFESGIVDCYKPQLSQTEIQKLERVVNTFKKSFYTDKD